MIRTICIPFVAALLTFGCNSGGEVTRRDSSKDSVKYAGFIMNTLMNSINYLAPDYSRELELIDGDPYYYSYKATKVLRKFFKSDTINGFTGYREIRDKELNLTLRIHRWTCGCEVSLPNTVLYVSNQKDFEYAFVLTDESKIRTNDTISEKVHSIGPPTLEFQLNLLINALKINSMQSTKEAEHFFALVTDSLLCLKRLSVGDVNELQKEEEAYNKENMQQPDCSICAETINAQMDKMISEIKSGSDTILYYLSTTKYYPGFWRFEFTIKTGKIYITASFNKCICGKLHER
jgi:hypothetical protein